MSHSTRQPLLVGKALHERTVCPVFGAWPNVQLAAGSTRLGVYVCIMHRACGKPQLKHAVSTFDPC